MPHHNRGSLEALMAKSGKWFLNDDDPLISKHEAETRRSGDQAIAPALNLPKRISFFNPSHREADHNAVTHRLCEARQKHLGARKSSKGKVSLRLPDLKSNTWGGSDSIDEVNKKNEAEMMLKKYGRLNIDFSTKYRDHDLLVNAMLHINPEYEDNISVSSSVQEVSQRRPKYMPPVVIETSCRVRITARTYLRKLYKDVIQRLVDPPKPQRNVIKRHPLSGDPYKVHLPAIAFQQKGGRKIKPEQRLKFVESELRAFEGSFGR